MYTFPPLRNRINQTSGAFRRSERQSKNAINVSYIVYSLYLGLKVYYILPFMNMDLISAPSGENSSRTKPVVNLGVVDAVSAEQKIITDGASSFEDDETLSEDDVDSDNSDDPWETESLYEDALQIVRDDQLQGGTRFNPPRYR
jgi:hypothetical protein